MTSQHEKTAQPAEELLTKAQDDPPKQAAGKDSGLAAPNSGRRTLRRHSLAYTHCHAIVPCPTLAGAADDQLNQFTVSVEPVASQRSALNALKISPLRAHGARDA